MGHGYAFSIASRVRKKMLPALFVGEKQVLNSSTGFCYICFCSFLLPYG
jgi:hypothetical protein